MFILQWEEPLGFIYLSIKPWNNPGNISLPWNCASILKSHTNHPEQHQPPIEPKPTTIRLIIYKHTHTHTHTHTHILTKLHHLTHGRSQGKLSNPWGSKRKSRTHLPSSFFLIKTRKTKIKLQIDPACSFYLATPGTKRKTHLLGR